jgi:preprotein translocase subunit SecG
MLLYYAIATLHVIVCVILVLVVLLQSGKGADLAGAFGGGATQTAFGSRGPASFLSKMTTAAAIVFMLTSIGLSLITTTKSEGKSVLETTKQRSAPVQKAPVQQKSAPVATPTPEQIKQKLEEIEKQKQQAAPAPAPAPASPQTQKPGNKK